MGVDYKSHDTTARTKVSTYLLGAVGAPRLMHGRAYAPKSVDPSETISPTNTPWRPGLKRRCSDLLHWHESDVTAEKKVD